MDLRYGCRHLPATWRWRAACVLLLVCEQAFAAPASFPGPTTSAPSPVGSAQVIWIEAHDKEPHRLELNFEGASNFPIMNFDRRCAVEWAPSGRHFAVSDFFASNQSRVVLFFVSESGPPTQVSLRFPAQVASLLKAHDHSYQEVVEWSPRGLLLVVHGYGRLNDKDSPDEFRRKLECRLNSETAARCDEVMSQ